MTPQAFMMQKVLMAWHGTGSSAKSGSIAALHKSLCWWAQACITADHSCKRGKLLGSNLLCVPAARLRDTFCAPVQHCLGHQKERAAFPPGLVPRTASEPNPRNNFHVKHAGRGRGGRLPSCTPTTAAAAETQP